MNSIILPKFAAIKKQPIFKLIMEVLQGSHSYLTNYKALNTSTVICEIQSIWVSKWIIVAISLSAEPEIPVRRS